MGYDPHEQGSHVGSSAINMCSHVIWEMPGIQRTTKANPRIDNPNICSRIHPLFIIPSFGMPV